MFLDEALGISLGSLLFFLLFYVFFQLDIKVYEFHDLDLGSATAMARAGWDGTALDAIM